ncbi:MAG: hypothetical protein KBC15_03040, partial [Candidatus Levybacteria bacterium]|nr:hypothetical protein [Candidatus Levybacteria bacterium]
MSARLHKILLFTLLAVAGISALLFTSLRAQKVIAAAGVNKVINFQGKVTNANGTNVTDGTYDFVIKLYDAATSTATNTYTESWTTAALWSSTMSSAPTSGQESLTYSSNTNESTIKVGQILWNTTKEEPVVVVAVNTGTNIITISPTRQTWATGDTVTNKIYVKDGTFKVAINALNQDLSGVNFGTDNVFLGINFNADGEMKPRIQYTASPYAMNAEKVNGLTVTNTSDAAFSSTTTLKIADGKTLVFNNGLTFSGTDST